VRELWTQGGNVDIMPNETVNRIIDAKVAGADTLKIQAAKTLEDAAP